MVVGSPTATPFFISRPERRLVDIVGALIDLFENHIGHGSDPFSRWSFFFYFHTRTAAYSAPLATGDADPHRTIRRSPS